MELQHHGILGQRWGRRNGPPYPLSEGDHSASEKKAGWKKSLLSGNPEKKYNKAVKRLKKIESKYDKRQQKANKLYEKAVQKQYSVLGSSNRIYAVSEKKREKAKRQQFKANRLAYKGQKQIEKVIKYASKAEIDISPDVMKSGEKMVAHVISVSRSMYAQDAFR